MGHEYFSSSGRNNPSLAPQDSPETSPRKSCPSSTTCGLEPFGQKATTQTIRSDILDGAVTNLEALVGDAPHCATRDRRPLAPTGLPLLLGLEKPRAADSDAPPSIPRYANSSET